MREGGNWWGKLGLCLVLVEAFICVRIVDVVFILITTLQKKSWANLQI